MSGFAFGQYSDDFLAYTLLADLVNCGSHFADRSPSGRLNPVPQSRTKSHSAQYPKLVFLKALAGIAYCPDEFCCDVFLSADVVQRLLCQRVIKQSINGEIPAQHV